LQFKAVLNASRTGLNTGRYLRLIALAVTDISLVLFATLFILISSVKVNGISPFSWHAVHIEFATISQYPEDLLLGAYSTYATTVYLYPVYSFSFFVFFGFGEEAIQEYMARWSQLQTSFLRIMGRRSVELWLRSRCHGEF
jgi:pheromone a factor receptor